MADETLTKVIVDCETGITKIVPLTLEEIADSKAQAEAFAAEQAAREAEAAQKEADRQAGIDALKKLGLTDAQISALIA